MRGRLPVTVDVDGHRAFHCEVSDLYPVLDDLRDWMERCLSFDRNGKFHPEIVTLNLADSVYSFVLVHVGWEGCDQSARPVSVFIIVKEDRRHPSLCEFCYPEETICSLYGAILSCLDDYRRLFDNPVCWYDVKRFDLLDGASHTDRMLDAIRSSPIELKCKFFNRGTGH